VSVAASTTAIEPVAAKPKLDQGMGPRTVMLFMAIMALVARVIQIGGRAS
jgi:hypothetical protein